MPSLDAANHAGLRRRQRDTTGLQQGVWTDPLHDLPVPVRLLEPPHEFPSQADSKRDAFEDLPGEHVDHRRIDFEPALAAAFFSDFSRFSIATRKAILSICFWVSASPECT